jgi:hypothetical protein
LKVMSSASASFLGKPGCAFLAPAAHMHRIFGELHERDATDDCQQTFNSVDGVKYRRIIHTQLPLISKLSQDPWAAAKHSNGPPSLPIGNGLMLA